MKVVICGSRVWTNEPVINAFICSLPKKATVIVGGAMGADEIARQAALRRGLDVIVVKPDWSLGKAGGPIRNGKMLDMGPDLVCAFWIGKTTGTQDCVHQAMERGIPTRIEWRAP